MRWKRTISALIISIATLFFCRAYVYSRIVTYHDTGARPIYTITDPALQRYIDSATTDLTAPSAQEIIRRAEALTAARLRYTTGHNENDPNKLIHTGTAHCVGYAAFFSVACEYLMVRYRPDDRWIATPHVGHIYLLGTDLHQYFDSPFMMDHDFVLIRNIHTGETLAVDPTIADYGGIYYVAYTH